MFLNSGAALLSPSLKYVCECPVFIIYRHRTKKSQKRFSNENIKRTLNFDELFFPYFQFNCRIRRIPSNSVRKSLKMSHSLKKANLTTDMVAITDHQVNQYYPASEGEMPFHQLRKTEIRDKSFQKSNN